MIFEIAIFGQIKLAIVVKAKLVKGLAPRVYLKMHQKVLQ